MRLCGIETEYGLAIEGRGPGTQLQDAAELVRCCSVEAFGQWDYAFETPRADLRGFQAEELLVDPEDARWDTESPTRSEREVRADKILVNGARFYNDHGHPEYATPECNRLLDVVAHDLAGEAVVQAAAAKFSASNGLAVRVFKNNTDFHGASYGTHENYRVERGISFERLYRGLIPYFVCRQILTGAGKVGSEVGKPARYQLSQRADFMSELASVDTLYRRPIFNTRDEPHDDASKWVRLHVICGDSNRMQWATAMKVGMTSLFIDLVRDGAAPIWDLCSPVKAIEHISKDERLEWRVELANGSWTTATEVVDAYASAAETLYAGRDAETNWILTELRAAIEDLRSDPMRLRNRCDWAAKLWLLQQFADAEGGWNDQTMKSLDLQYHLVDENESLFRAYAGGGEVIELVSPARVAEAMENAPPTRARLRAAAVQNKEELVSLGWRRAVFDKDGVTSVQIWDSESHDLPS